MGQTETFVDRCEAMFNFVGGNDLARQGVAQGFEANSLVVHRRGFPGQRWTRVEKLSQYRAGYVETTGIIFSD